MTKTYGLEFKGLKGSDKNSGFLTSVLSYETVN